MRARTEGSRSASQRAGAARVQVGERLLRQRVEPARRHVLLELAVPGFGVELQKPRPEFGQLLAGQPADGPLDGGHDDRPGPDAHLWSVELRLALVGSHAVGQQR